MFCFFVPEARGISAPGPGIEPTPPALECEVLTTELLGKSLCRHFKLFEIRVKSWSVQNRGLKSTDHRKSKLLLPQKPDLICVMWTIISYLHL